MEYVLTLGHKVCLFNEDNVSLIGDISSATKFSKIGDAMRKAAYLIKELGTNVTIKKL